MKPGEAAGVLAGGAGVPHREGEPLKIGASNSPRNISVERYIEREFLVFSTAFGAPE